MSKKIWKDLTEEDKEYIASIYYEEGVSHDEKMDILSDKFGVVGRTIRKWWKDKLNLSESPNSKLPRDLEKAKVNEIHKNTDVVLFTAAQNKTHINRKAWNSMLKYRDFINSLGKNCQIVVAPSRYRNPTSLIDSDNKKSEQWWMDDIIPYLQYGKRYIGDTMLATSTRIRPTAKEPMTGYELLANNHNLVLPHPKIHFKTMPRFKNQALRTMSTTGFITHKNYSDSKAGDIASENHSYGFVVIEKKKDGTCHVPRNVKIDKQGNFCDIGYYVTPDSVTVIEKIKGIVWGDWHTRNINKVVFEKTTDLLKKLKPDNHVLHDVLDASSVNPHESKDMFIQRLKITQNAHLIEEEINETFDWLKKLDPIGGKVHVILSNHDVFLDRYVNDFDWKKDLHNSPSYLKYAYIQQTVDLREYGTMYGYLLKQEMPEVSYVNYGESLKLFDYEVGEHGDSGINGARGNYKSFSRLNTKMIFAHGHSPVIHNGVTMVGVTCEISQYYTRKGMSSWAYAHDIIHIETEKNQLIVFDDDYELSSFMP